MIKQVEIMIIVLFVGLGKMAEVFLLSLFYGWDKVICYIGKRREQFMKGNYTVMFILLFVASIVGGLALKGVFDYSMLVGFGLGIVFLLCSAFVEGKRQYCFPDKRYLSYFPLIAFWGVYYTWVWIEKRSKRKKKH